MRIYNVILFILWLVLTLYVGHRIIKLDRIEVREGAPVAVLINKKGEVRFKVPQKVIWNDVMRRQVYFDGDLISTGENSIAKLGFYGAGTVEVAENSQIRISSIKSKEGEKFYIELMKGTIDAKALQTKEKKGKMIIKSKNDQKEISRPGDRIIVKNSLHGRSEVLKYNKSGDSLVAKQQELKKLSFGGPVFHAKSILPDFKKPVIIEPKAFKKAHVVEIPKNFSYQFTDNETRKLFWIFQKFEDISESQYTWSLDVHPTQHPLKIGEFSLRPVIETSTLLKGKVNKKFAFHGDNESTDYASDQQIKIDLYHTLPEDSFNYPAGVGTLNLKLSSGGILNSVSHIDELQFGPNEILIRVKSFDEFSEGAVVVNLQSLDEVSDIKRMLPQRNILTASNARYTVALREKRFISELKPFLSATDSFSINPSPFPISKSGIFLVKNGQIIIQSKNTKDDSSMQKLMDVFDADFAFKGSFESFIPGVFSPGSEIEQYTKSLLGEGKRIFVLKDERIHPINVDFIANNEEVKKFITQQTEAFFKEEVELIVRQRDDL